MYLVRCVDGQTVCVPLDQGHTAEDILLSAAAKKGWTNVTGLGLEHAGRQLDLADTLAGRVESGSTLHMTCRVLGGKLVPVHFITPIDGKDSVMVNIEDDSPMYEVKIQLQELTGVPVADQKIMLQGVGHIVMGDKRSNIGYTHSGSTGSFYLGLLGNNEAGSSK